MIDAEVKNELCFATKCQFGQWLCCSIPSVQRASVLASLDSRTENEASTGGLMLAIPMCSMPRYLTKIKFAVGIGLRFFILSLGFPLARDFSWMS